MFRTLLAVGLSIHLLAACASGHAASGQSLALQDDEGKTFVTWDGHDARVYRDGGLVGEAAASSWEAAMWTVDLAPRGAVTAAYHYDRVLAPGDLPALEVCTWPATHAVKACGLDTTCDCKEGALASSR
ncbi:MAG: hypothetical protein KC656_02840 [Myxococcales bacterium]|nr:hypothetical protein [Myxococcales bacterium]MCB9670578.1 hypothetical protein [Alphaproteobacteria bacterium]MCB9691929.1 hypothetical protein [Alphaproteobacteria bacterium]